jgi:hypothetical protein
MGEYDLPLPGFAPWLTIAAGVLLLVGYLFRWMLLRLVASIEVRLQRIEQIELRLVALEVDLRHAPNNEDLIRIHTRMDAQNATLERLAGQSDRVVTQVDRIEDYLRHQQ